jgi:hypothetical protein
LKHKLLLNGVPLLAAAAVGRQVEYLVRLIPVASIALLYRLNF